MEDQTRQIERLVAAGKPAEAAAKVQRVDSEFTDEELQALRDERQYQGFRKMMDRYGDELEREAVAAGADGDGDDDGDDDDDVDKPKRPAKRAGAKRGAARGGRHKKADDDDGDDGKPDAGAGAGASGGSEAKGGALAWLTKD
jgi:hypothetical protein